MSYAVRKSRNPVNAVLHEKPFGNLKCMHGMLPQHEIALVYVGMIHFSLSLKWQSPRPALLEPKINTITVTSHVYHRPRLSPPPPAVIHQREIQCTSYFFCLSYKKTVEGIIMPVKFSTILGSE